VFCVFHFISCPLHKGETSSFFYQLHPNVSLLRALSFLDDEIALTFVVIKAIFNLRPGIWLLRVGFLATVSAIRRYIQFIQALLSLMDSFFFDITLLGVFL
jgi:hypothetical protein